MTEAFICDAIRTPIGRYGGALSSVRTDDLAALPIKWLMERNSSVDWSAVDDVTYGCVNQAGEDNRNVGRMALLLAGLPAEVPGNTVNRLCGSGMDATGLGARALKTGEADLVITGGVESMSRSPFVMGKAETAFSRNAEIFDTTIGWRFVNRLMKQQYGVDSMPETAENVAEEHQISREDQDKFAFWSQEKAAAAQADGRLAEEIRAVTIPQRRGDDIVVEKDEHPRATTLEKLASLTAPFREGGSVTAGNASGVNDGSCALLLASEAGAKAHGLTPKARIIGMASAGVAPRVMGIGPAPASQKLLNRLGLTIDQMDVIELNEAFAAQGLAVTRMLGIEDEDPRNHPGEAGVFNGPLP
jgi:acetyl-CoA acyltransferase